MYKLFLTIRYLTRKKIVIFPILVVWLCVMMLIIVTSIMGGFVDRVRDANHDLFGDIVISGASSSRGFSGYEELSNKLRAKFPEIQSTTPVVEAFALLYAPASRQTLPGLIVGVRPEERSQVSQFRQSLFRQYRSPMEAVNELATRLPATRDELVRRAEDVVDKAQKDHLAAFAALADLNEKPRAPAPALTRLTYLAVVAIVGALLLLRARKKRTGAAYLTAALVSVAGVGLVAATVFWPVWFPRQYTVAEDRAKQTKMDRDESLRTMDYALALPAGTYRSREDLIKAIVPAKPSFDVPKAATEDLLPGLAPPKEGCIVGSQMAYRRDTRGNFIHQYPDFYSTVTITVFPPSNSGLTDVKGTNAVTQNFTVVDDSHTGVYDVDSMNIYAPFETVQLMAGLRPDPALVKDDPSAKFEPRCHQILIRLKPDSLGAGRDLKLLRKQIGDVVEAFLVENPQPDSLDVQTWDEKQAKYLGAVQNEKTMMTFIMLLMSVVVLVVIFLIFYQIVRDKTRDIGIIKAVGGSEEGVAAIFLSYGLMIGVVGGGLGVLTGCLFMTHTNEIHEWIFQTTGMIIWDRSVYLFDRIPDVVHTSDVVVYFGVAVVAGVVGALIPAVLAALEDPVQAVRYE